MVDKLSKIKSRLRLPTAAKKKPRSGIGQGVAKKR